MTPRLFFSGHLSLGHASSDCRPFWGGQIAAFDMESGLTTADYGWGTKNFRQLGLRKTELVVQLLRAKAPPLSPPYPPLPPPTQSYTP